MAEITIEFLKAQLMCLPLADNVIISAKDFQEILRLQATTRHGSMALDLHVAENGINIPARQLRELLRGALTAKEEEKERGPLISSLSKDSSTWLADQNSSLPPYLPAS